MLEKFLVLRRNSVSDERWEVRAMSSMSSVILADQVSPLPCFYNNSTGTGKLTITVHSWSVSQTIIIAGCVREGREGREGQHFNRKLFSRRVMGGRRRRRRFCFNTHWQGQDRSGLLCFFISTEKNILTFCLSLKDVWQGKVRSRNLSAQKPNQLNWKNLDAANITFFLFRLR